MKKKKKEKKAAQVIDYYSDTFNSIRVTLT